MSTASDPARTAVAVTLDVSLRLSDGTRVWPRALYVGAAGDVAVTMADGQAMTFAGAQAGSVLPISVRTVNTSGTTASSIVALY